MEMKYLKNKLVLSLSTSSYPEEPTIPVPPAIRRQSVELSALQNTSAMASLVSNPYLGVSATALASTALDVPVLIQIH